MSVARAYKAVHSSRLSVLPPGCILTYPGSGDSVQTIFKKFAEKW